LDLLKFIGRTRQFEQRLGESRPRLWRLAHAWCRNRALADDLVQDALAKGLRNHAQLRDEESLHAWLCGILAHCWHDHLRAHRPMEDVADMDEAALVADGSPETDYLKSEIVRRVRQAVAELPVPQREVVTLVDLEEFSYAEVAAILEVPIGTVMSRLSRARNALKERLRGQSACELAAPRIARVK
jgi:RNA polymerase sigma-70 factor (ECF subfamily)